MTKNYTNYRESLIWKLDKKGEMLKFNNVVIFPRTKDEQSVGNIKPRAPIQKAAAV
jgi:hypothetical protein